MGATKLDVGAEEAPRSLMPPSPVSLQAAIERHEKDERRTIRRLDVRVMCWFLLGIHGLVQGVASTRFPASFLASSARLQTCGVAANLPKPMWPEIYHQATHGVTGALARDDEDLHIALGNFT
jgi:hypothetical protein